MKDWYTEKRVSRSIFGSILEYEYLYLNGELDIDCIYLKKRREHIGTYKVADMEALFPLDAKRFREYRTDFLFRKYISFYPHILKAPLFSRQ